VKLIKCEGNYYTEDRVYKIRRCAVRKWGWTVSKRRENSYKHVFAVSTLEEARRKIERETT